MSPVASMQALGDSLARLTPDGRWQIQRSDSRGRQRAVIASVHDIEPVRGFDGIVEYDAAAQGAILRAMIDEERANLQFDLSAGLAVAAAFVTTQGGRLLALSVDFECSGDGPEG